MKDPSSDPPRQQHLFLSSDPSDVVPLVYQFVSFQLQKEYILSNELDYYPPLSPLTRHSNSNFKSGSVRASDRHEDGSISDRGDLSQSRDPASVAHDQPLALVWRRDTDTPCKNNTNALSTHCIHTTKDNMSIVLPEADMSNTTGGTDLVPTLTSVYPITCASNGWTLLGELNKFVPLSPLRIQAITCTKRGLEIEVIGAVGEVVELVALDEKLNVHVREVIIKESESTKCVFANI